MNFSVFGGFQKNEYSFGYESFVDVFWGHHKIGLYLGVIFYALPLLDYMRFAMEASTEWKIGGGGGAHTPAPQPWDCDKCPTPTLPKFPFFFCFGLGGGTKVFYPPRPDYRRFKIPSFTSPGHTHSLVCAPTTTFSFSRPVMSYKLSFPIMHYRIYSQYHIYNA